MRKPSVLIYTEAGPGVGLGHVTRCAHLAAVLRQAGAETYSWPNRPTAATGFLRSRDVFSDYDQADIAVVDVMRWNEGVIGTLADEVKKVAVIVGAGQPPIVSGLVDLVVYQTGWATPDGISGPDYLILGPDYAPPLVGRNNPIRDGVLVCFGEGIPDDYVQSVGQALYQAGAGGTLVIPPYTRSFEIEGFSTVIAPDGLAALQKLHKIQVGSIGMSTYEALAAGCYPVTVARSADHAETGKRLTELGLGLCVGEYDKIPAEVPARLAMVTLPAVQLLMEVAPKIDGLGAERVARTILEMI